MAADPHARGRGAIIAINDDLHSARDVTKSSTTDVQAFVSPGAGLLGTASYGRMRYFRYPTHPHTSDSEFSVEGEVALPRVDILHAHANMPADLVRASAALGAQGIVIAGMGNGNVSTEVAQTLADVASSGVIVVRSSRVGSGDVGRNIELDDDGLGLVASDQLNPQKSRVLLQLCLLRGLQRGAIQDAFFRYSARGLGDRRALITGRRTSGLPISRGAFRRCQVWRLQSPRHRWARLARRCRRASRVGRTQSSRIHATIPSRRARAARPER